MRGMTLLLGLLCIGIVVAEEVKPGTLRTPDVRFAELADYPFAPGIAI